jgi:mitogen-activated protein kinase kinase kinase 3
MPAWWPVRKSCKNKEQNPVNAHLNPSKSSVKNDRLKAKDKEKPNSFDEVVLRNSPRTSKDFGGSSGFSGCDSDGGDRVGHPLPLPSILSGNDSNNSVVVGLGSGSGSVSSVSSSGSSEDQPVAQEHGQVGQFRLVFGALEDFFFFFFCVIFG